MVDLDTCDRQVRCFGAAGQARLSKCKIVIVGLGGVGSLLAQYLARLGVGNFILADDALVELSNLSRIVGASEVDAIEHVPKVTVAARVILEANPKAEIQAIIDDVAKKPIALSFKSCDYPFLAADSMHARLVINAIVHWYIVPGVQLGSKIRTDGSCNVLDEMSANRPNRPARLQFP